MKNCVVCGKDISDKHCLSKYCSRYCKHRYFYKSQKGNKLFIKNQVKFCIICGKEFTSGTKNQKSCGVECGKKLSQQLSREKALENRKIIKSERTRGRLRTFEYIEWRNSVFKRDNYQCQVCGDKKGHNLNAHHIKNYYLHQNLRLNLDNGITLCENCHITFHSLYGKKNNDAKQIEEFKANYNNFLIQAV